MHNYCGFFFPTSSSLKIHFPWNVFLNRISSLLSSQRWSSTLYPYSAYYPLKLREKLERNVHFAISTKFLAQEHPAKAKFKVVSGSLNRAIQAPQVRKEEAKLANYVYDEHSGCHQRWIACKNRRHIQLKPNLTSFAELDRMEKNQVNRLSVSLVMAK